MPLMKRDISQPLPQPPDKLDEPQNETAPTQAEAPRRIGGIRKAGDRAAAPKSGMMTRADWDSKDRRISRAGLWQACMHSVGLLQLNTGNTLADYMAIVRQAAEEGLKFINETE